MMLLLDDVCFGICRYYFKYEYNIVKIVCFMYEVLINNYELIFFICLYDEV